jgi:hypothetical protein
MSPSPRIMAPCTDSPHPVSVDEFCRALTGTALKASPPAPEPATNDKKELTMSVEEKMTGTRCQTCCYWSELIAKTRGGLLVAMCLAADGPRAWRYTRNDADCPAWEEARDGAIDDPDTGELARMHILEKTSRMLSGQ